MSIPGGGYHEIFLVIFTLREDDRGIYLSLLTQFVQLPVVHLLISYRQNLDGLQNTERLKCSASYVGAVGGGVANGLSRRPMEGFK